MSSFTLDADTGTSQTISNGNTLTIFGSTGIDTVVGNTDTVTVNLDLSEVTTVTSIDPLCRFLSRCRWICKRKNIIPKCTLRSMG